MIDLWLVGDLVTRHALGVEQARAIALDVLREARADMYRAARAMDVDPALGVAARTLACRLSHALGRLGDPVEAGRAGEGERKKRQKRG